MLRPSPVGRTQTGLRLCEILLSAPRITIVLAALTAATLTGCAATAPRTTQSAPAKPTGHVRPVPAAQPARAKPAAHLRAAPAAQMTSFCQVGYYTYDGRFWPVPTTPTGYASNVLGYGPNGYVNVVRVRVKDISRRAVLLSQFGITISSEGVVIDSGVAGQDVTPWIGPQLPELLSPRQSSAFIVELPLNGTGTQLTASQYRQSQCRATPG